LLLAVAEAVLLKVVAFAECGVVEVEDGYEFVAETLLWCVASDAEFEVCAGLVKIAYEVEGAGCFTIFFGGLTSKSVARAYTHCAGVPRRCTVNTVVFTKFGSGSATVLKICQY
jgi:hypothetical protein